MSDTWFTAKAAFCASRGAGSNMVNLITQYGRALYGARWRAAMADDLGVSERTVRRWAKGEFEVPEGVLRELREKCAAKAQELSALG